MTHLPCVLAHTIPGRHLDGCPIDGCDGCVSAVAADGVLVCGWHETRTRRHLREIPGLYDDLAPEMPGRAGSTVRGSDSGSPALIDDDRRQARSAIRALLVAWCLVIEEDLRVGVPAGATEPGVAVMCTHVARQASRLLAHPEHADQLVHDLESATTEAWRLARPASGRTIRILCDCGERVPVEPDGDVIMRCRGCGTWGVLSWWIEHTAPGHAEPVTLDAAVHLLWETYRVRITRAQAEGWVRRGDIAPVGMAAPDGPGRPAATYRVRQLLRRAIAT